MKRIILIAVACFALPGCSNQEISDEEKLCRTQITSTILNPESVEFHDFSSIAPDTYLDVIASAAAKQKFDEVAGIAEMSNQGSPMIMAKVIASEADEAGAGERLRRSEWLKKEPHQTYSVRYRYEDAKGAKITHVAYCAEDRVSCECVIKPDS